MYMYHRSSVRAVNAMVCMVMQGEDGSGDKADTAPLQVIMHCMPNAIGNHTICCKHFEHSVITNY
jgi:hypothetical protein